ncbi:MAG: ABC transporter substrate-binding protein [Ruminococcaceae bacterium]|nr:ABC transporter substrate-binding protein [Oscillospiraceae bacterium]
MKKHSALLALLLAMLMLLSACGAGQGNAPAAPAAPDAPEAAAPAAPAAPEAEAPEEDAEPKTLNIGIILTSDTFDPTLASNNPALQEVYDSILTRDPVTYEVIPNLAESWEYNEDGTVMTLHFRDDVYFTNGEKLTPEDALYSLSRYTVNDQFYSDCGWDNINFDESYAEGNDLVLKLNSSTPLIEAQLADGNWGTVLCKSYVEANPDSFWDAPVGSGPYILTENVADSHYALVRNENYWNGVPDVSNVNYFIYGDATTMFIDFENGALDIAVDVAAADAARVINGEVDAQYQMMDTHDINYLSLPWYTPEFDDINLRKAISLALDIEGITRSAFGDMAEVADSVAVKGLPFYESQGEHVYDLDQAKQLMAETGYEPGELTFNLVVFSMPPKQKQAEAIQACLAEIGINVTIEAYDPPTAIPIYMAMGTGIALGGTNGSNYDLAKYMSDSAADASNQTTAIKDEQYNEWLSTGRYSLDPEERAECYSNIQKWQAENYRWIPINYTKSCTVFQNNVHDISGFVYNRLYLEHITMD